MSDYIYKMITDQIIRLLQEGTIPWKRPWADNGPPRNLASQRPYRGFNVFMLSLRGYASPFWLTAKQLERMGGQIKPEEKPVPVVCWRWRAMIEIASGKDESGEKEIWSPWCWFYEVFNTDQCLGITHKLPKIRRREFNPIQTCEKIVGGMPTRPKLEHTEAKACYRPLFDTVNMPNADLFSSNEEYYSVLFHELVHSTGHQERLGRHKILKKGFDSFVHMYSQEELVAEMGAAFLCAHAGIESSTMENSGAYIEAWLKKLNSDKRAVFFAAAHAQKAVDFILGKKIKSPARNLE